MTVRLEELLAAATPGPWTTSDHGSSIEIGDAVQLVAEIDVSYDVPFNRQQCEADAALAALAPDAVRLLIDMGKALRRHQAMGYAPGEDVQMRRELEDLLARLDRLGNTT